MGITAKAAHISVKAYLDPNSDILFKHLALSDSTSMIDGLSLSRGLNLVLTDSITPAEAPTVLVGADLQKALADSFTPTDAVSKSLSMVLADSVAPTDAVARNIGMTLADATTPTESLTPVITPTATTTWNPADKSADITLAGGNRQAKHTGATSNYVSVRSTTSKTTGKFYVEFTLTKPGASQGAVCGVGDNFLNMDDTNRQGYTDSIACSDTGGDVYALNTNIIGLGTIQDTDVVGMAVDVTNGKIWFRRNNGNWNADASANPATNTNGYAITAAVAYPLFLLAGFNFGSGSTTFYTVNVGQAAFTYVAPAGFSAWG